MKRKSYFNKILKNCILSMLVPLVAMVLILLYTNAAIRKEIEISRQNTLKQFLAVVDTVAGEMEDICLAMIDNEKCQRYSRLRYTEKDKGAYEILEVKNALNVYSAERYYDTFIYYPYEGRIISGERASTTPWHYYNSYFSSGEVYGKETAEWEEFQELLSCVSRRPVFKTLRKDGRDYLCAVMRQNQYMDARLDYAAVVVLQPEYLKRLIGSNTMASDMVFMLFDADRELLLSVGKEITEFHLSGEDGQSSYGVEIENEKYMLQVLKAENMTGYYAVATPMDYFYERLRILHVTCGLGIAISILLGIAIAWYGSVRSWNPIEALYEKVTGRDKTFSDSGVENELKHIELLFQKTNEENRQLYRRAKDGKQAQKDKLLMSLLEDSGKMMEKQSKALEKAGVSFPWECFYACLFKVEKEPDEDRDMLLFVLRNVFEELSCELGQGTMISISETKCCLLLNCRAEVQEKQLLNLLQEGMRFVDEHYHILLTMGISEIHEGVPQIAAAYSEASEAFSYRYLQGKGAVISYSRIKGRDFSYDSFVENKLYAQLARYVQSGQTQKPADFFNEVMTAYGIGKDASLRTVECFQFEMMLACYQVMMRSGYGQQLRKEKLEKMLLIAGLDEFREYMVELLEELCTRNREIAQQNDVCIRAKEFIEQRYWDDMLSLDMISEQTESSPSYLSRKFKERWGISVVEYITEVRIRKAKQLLTDTSQSVWEVAEEVGYLSSSTFVKTFKKKEGVTPGVWREIHKEDSGE